MATATNEIDEIRRYMAQIRRELHEDVRDVVATAEAVTDWRRYLRAYPWATVGVAFAVGYLIVPKRHRQVPRDVARQVDVERVVEAVAPSKKAVKKAEKKGLIGMALGFVAPVAMRAAQGYAVRYLEQWITQQQMQAMGVGPAPSAAPHPQSPPGSPRTGGFGWPGGAGGAHGPG